MQIAIRQHQDSVARDSKGCEREPSLVAARRVSAIVGRNATGGAHRAPSGQSEIASHGVRRRPSLETERETGATSCMLCGRCEVVAGAGRRATVVKSADSLARLIPEKQSEINSEAGSNALRVSSASDQQEIPKIGWPDLQQQKSIE